MLIGKKYRSRFLNKARGPADGSRVLRIVHENYIEAKADSEDDHTVDPFFMPNKVALDIMDQTHAEVYPFPTA